VVPDNGKNTMKLARLVTCIAMAGLLGACAAEEADQPAASAEAELASPEPRETLDGEPTMRSAPEGEEHAEGGEGGEGREGGEGGEHAEGGEGEHGEEAEGGEEGEEGGDYIAASATWDVTRRGARLILSLNEARTAFVGTVENTTEATLCRVRVEVHLSPGPELGPTTPVDVAAGQTAVIELPTSGNEVETWTAHPEISAC